MVLSIAISCVSRYHRQEDLRHTRQSLLGGAKSDAHLMCNIGLNVVVEVFCCRDKGVQLLGKNDNPKRCNVRCLRAYVQFGGRIWFVQEALKASIDTNRDI